MQIGRSNISADAANAVRDLIATGQLREGERVNEVHLAERLGVSRTPLREALNRLAGEGALAVQPKRGMFVRPLTLDEFDQIYAIRALIEPEALRLAGVPDAAQLRRIEAVNVKLKAAQGEAAIALDDDWHRALIEACPNRVLLDIIANMIERTRRYELALMREAKNVATATGEHEQVMAALRAGDLDAACKALKQNLTPGREPIVKWLRERMPAKGQ